MSGTISQKVHAEYQKTVSNNVIFTIPFTSPPTVTVQCTYSNTAVISSFKLTTTNITNTGFTWTLTSGEYSWHTVTYKWVATAQ